jgi:hypothetical protein
MSEDKETGFSLSADEIEQSRQRSLQRLEEDTKKAGVQRGELFQNKDGSWSIAFSAVRQCKIGIKPSHTAVHKRNGMLRGIRQGTGTESKTVDFDGDILREATEIGTQRPKNQRGLERAAVGRFLPRFNEEHDACFVINDEIPEESDIKDIVIEDTSTGEKIGIQVTVSDADAKGELGKKGTYSRQGNTYQIFSKSVKAAIVKKGKSKYPNLDRNKTILVLDGWFSATPDVLQRFKTAERAFLKDQGYREIWFGGAIAETVARLY